MSGLNLHLYPSPLRHDSRMMRITDSLAGAGIFDRIDMVGLRDPELPTDQAVDGVRRIVRLPLTLPVRRIGGLGRLLQLLEWNVRIYRRYRNEDLRCVNPHIVWALPAAAALKRRHGCRMVYDTHELETETIGSRGIRKRISQWIERRWLRAADAVFVVSEGIERWYRERVAGVPVVAVKNYPYRRPSPVQSNLFREHFGIGAGDVIFIYQGRLSRGPEIETLLEAHGRLPESRHLVFMGFGPLVPRLETLADQRPNLHFHPGVPFDKVPEHTGSADVAIALFEDACLSYHHALPNKLLEALAAGIPAIVSNLPDMKAEIDGGAAGWMVENDVDSLTSLMAGLDRREVENKKKAARVWAAEHDWETEAERMLEVYRDVLRLH